MLKLILNKLFSTTKLIFFGIIFLISQLLYSQAAAGPYKYFAPHGRAVLTSIPVNITENTYGMDFLQKLSSNTDGLVVESNFEGIKDGDRLLTFHTTHKGILLEVFNKNETMMLRRYHSNGTHFDYILFDPLFRAPGYTPVDPIWTVRYFFTARFMWIEVQLYQTLRPITTQYLSLVYFGLDYDFRTGNSNMSEFLNRQNSAKITWGSPANSSGFKITGRLIIYEFNYANLSTEIQKKFSYPMQQSNKNSVSKIVGLEEKLISPKQYSNQKLSTNLTNIQKGLSYSVSMSKVKLKESNEIEIIENKNTTEEELTTKTRQYSNQKLIVYPNPSSEYFTVNINSEDDEKVLLTIFDIFSGRLLYQSEKYLKKGNNDILFHHQDIGITINSKILFLKIKGKKIDVQEKIVIHQ